MLTACTEASALSCASAGTSRKMAWQGGKQPPAQQAEPMVPTQCDPWELRGQRPAAQRAEPAVPTQYDLWGSVVPGGDNGAVMLVIKRCTAKINHPDGRVLHAPLISLLGERERKHQLHRSFTKQPQSLAQQGTTEMDHSGGALLGLALVLPLLPTHKRQGCSHQLLEHPGATAVCLQKMQATHVITGP